MNVRLKNHSSNIRYRTWEKNSDSFIKKQDLHHFPHNKMPAPSHECDIFYPFSWCVWVFDYSISERTFQFEFCHVSFEFCFFVILLFILYESKFNSYSLLRKLELAILMSYHVCHRTDTSNVISHRIKLVYMHMWEQ